VIERKINSHVTIRRPGEDRPSRRSPSGISYWIFPSKAARKAAARKKLTLLTIVTFPSTTSPLNGFITTAVYSHWNFADPSEGMIRPVPMFVTATTAMM